ncbi:hypothetical protein AWN72_00245 [Escherichia coli]|nr:hypothetical protein AWN72_00245 [Escherichia coli]
MFLKNLPEIANVIKPYCMEQADNVESLHNLLLPADAPFTTFEGKGLFSHKILIQTPGSRYERAIQSNNLVALRRQHSRTDIHR